MAKNLAVFDHCNLTNLIVRSNTTRFPENALEVDFEKNKYDVIYDNLNSFKQDFLPL